MRVGNFSVLVPEGREHGSGHVALQHNQQYTLRITNHWWDRACDAEVSIDGKEIGAFRLGRGDTISLERSPNDNGRFTFFTINSAEGEQAGVAEVPNADRGLIKVRFRPERKQNVLRTASLRSSFGGGGAAVYGGVTAEYSARDSARGLSVEPGFEREEKTSGGITGLTGHSDQQFVNVAALNYDESQEATIFLRLVHEQGPVVRKLQPVRSNPIPAPVQ